MLSKKPLQIVKQKLKGLLKNLELLSIAIATPTNKTKPTGRSCLGGFVFTAESLSVNHQP